MYVTKDYLYYNAGLSRQTQIYGIHHKFKFQTDKQTWFHPSIPIFMQKLDPYRYVFYLNKKLATEEEKLKFGIMKNFKYKSKTVFSLTGPSDPLTHAN